MDKKTQTELEAAAFRGFVQHLQKRTDVQNIDLMNLAGFCRNCLAKWYKAAANEQGVDLSMDDAKEAVYGMPYDEYKSKYQTKATDEQMAKYADKTGHAVIEV
ncbi:MAG: DUF1244 domain-containing protein [Methylocystaceae bacterium]|nr:DUF1244 domain-containing protein [Methylocystaceae bacterium]